MLRKRRELSILAHGLLLCALFANINASKEDEGQKGFPSPTTAGSQGSATISTDYQIEYTSRCPLLNGLKCGLLGDCMSRL